MSDGNRTNRAKPVTKEALEVGRWVGKAMLDVEFRDWVRKVCDRDGSVALPFGVELTMGDIDGGEIVHVR